MKLLFEERSAHLRNEVSVNIIGGNNGAGLAVDAKLLLCVLSQAGFWVTWSKGVQPRRILRTISEVGFGRFTQYDINVFLETILPNWLSYACKNVLIPNPEWFREENLAHMHRVDRVLCKSESARQMFVGKGYLAEWIGFSGMDHFFDEPAAGQSLSALHQAGRSEHKGTGILVKAWRQHPEWPMLTVLRRSELSEPDFDVSPADNIRFINTRLSDVEMLALQQQHPIHILTSETEGYGQTLSESMSVGAVVVTTDAPPMNELVERNRGVLVKAGVGTPMNFGFQYQVEIAALEAAVDEVISWTRTERMAMGLAARNWFLDNHERFCKDFPATLKAIAAGPPGHKDYMTS